MADHPFSTILVPLDGSELSEQALPFALAVAKSGGTVELLQVTPDAEPLRKPFGAITMSAEDVQVMIADLATEDLDRAEERWASLTPSVTIKKRVTSGDAAAEIIDIAEQDNADLVVMASSGRGAIGRLTLGSVADKVVRHGTRPILIVRETDAQESVSLPKVTRVIVPLDGSDRAMAAVPVAAVLGQQLGASIELISAIDLPQVVSPAMSYGPAFSPEFYTDIEEESTKVANEYLDEAIAELQIHGATGTKHVSLGSAVAAVMDFAQTSDLVVMTSRGQGGFKRWLMGSVAEKLIRECKAPVLVVPTPHEG